VAEKENEKGEKDDEDEEKEVAERRDEAYATLTTSATPSMRAAGVGATGMSSCRGSSCCSARRREGGTRAVENDTAALR